jgi:hypothetical protein
MLSGLDSSSAHDRQTNSGSDKLGNSDFNSGPRKHAGNYFDYISHENCLSLRIGSIVPRQPQLDLITWLHKRHF